MKYAIAILALPTLLAGCGKGDVDLKDASVEDVVKATVKSKSINPGQWSVSTEVLSVDLPGMPEKEKAMMAAMTKAMVGRKNIAESCVTKEQAEKPPAELFSGKNAGNCSFENFSIDNGEMNATMNCTPSGGQAGAMKTSMKGQYGGDSYDIASEINMSGVPGAPGGTGMTIKSHSAGKRTGECKAVKG